MKALGGRGMCDGGRFLWCEGRLGAGEDEQGNRGCCGKGEVEEEGRLGVELVADGREEKSDGNG